MPEHTFWCLNFRGVRQYDHDVGRPFKSLHRQILAVSCGNQSVDLDFLFRRAIRQSDAYHAEQCYAAYDPSMVLLHTIVLSRLSFSEFARAVSDSENEKGQGKCLSNSLVRR